MLKNPANWEYVQVQFENFTNLNVHSIEHASNAKAQVSDNLIQFIEDRFINFDEPVLANMKWLDPKNWTDDSDYRTA